MKDFVTSQPAAGALFAIVLGELCDFSVPNFRRKFERYAEGGGDGGLTRGDRARGSPRRLRGPPPGRPLSRGPLGQARAWWKPWRRPAWLAAGRRPGACSVCHVSLVKHCPERGWDFCSGAPRQQVAPGRVAESGGKGPCGDPAATEGERVVESATAEMQVRGAVDSVHPNCSGSFVKTGIPQDKRPIKGVMEPSAMPRFLISSCFERIRPFIGVRVKKNRWQRTPLWTGQHNPQRKRHCRAQHTQQRHRRHGGWWDSEETGCSNLRQV